MLPIILYVCFHLFGLTSNSILTAPPLSAVIVAFENIYDISLLANTLSDQGIDTMLIIPTHAAKELYNNLVDVEILQLNINIDKPAYSEERYALEACDSLFKDQDVLKRIQELQPTFTIFPALRYVGHILQFIVILYESVSMSFHYLIDLIYLFTYVSNILLIKFSETCCYFSYAFI